MSDPRTHYVLQPVGFTSFNHACERLGVSRPTLNRWVKKLDALKIQVNGVNYLHDSAIRRIEKARSLQ